VTFFILESRLFYSDVNKSHVHDDGHHNDDRFGCSTQCTTGTLTQRVSSTGTPQSDGALKNADSKKIRHYRQIYEDRTDPVIFLSVTVNTQGHLYDDFVRLIFLHAHREGSILAGELPEESDQFRFLRAARFGEP
jgi:hypothetical protein